MAKNTTGTTIQYNAQPVANQKRASKPVQSVRVMPNRYPGTPPSTRVIRTPVPQEQYTPLGYNRDAYMRKVNAAYYNNFGPTIDPQLNPQRINQDTWVRSINQSARPINNFQWTPLVELAKLPITGDAKDFQTQYVQVPLNVTNTQKVAQAIRTTFHNKVLS